MMNQKSILTMLTIQMDYEKVEYLWLNHKVEITYTIEVETITEHQFPRAERSCLKRLYRTPDSETELHGTFRINWDMQARIYRPKSCRGGWGLPSRYPPSFVSDLRYILGLQGGGRLNKKERYKQYYHTREIRTNIGKMHSRWRLQRPERQRRQTSRGG